MGLGKTLQTICIMAGDDFYRRQNYAVTPTANFQPLPSLVVCPPTLVGHWCNEIQKFCEPAVKPLSYMGSPSERAK
jgi:TATA-binding protein-associated factor